MTAALDMNEWPCRIRGYLVSMAMSHLWLPCIRGHVVSVATLYPCRICGYLVSMASIAPRRSPGRNHSVTDVTGVYLGVLLRVETVRQRRVGARRGELCREASTGHREVDVSAAVEQRGARVDETALGGQVERRGVLVEEAVVPRGARWRQQGTYSPRLVAIGGGVKWGASCGLRGVGVGALAWEKERSQGGRCCTAPRRYV